MEMPENADDWFDLPYEIREMIFEKMDNETKLVFFTSSPEFLMDIPRYVKKIHFGANEILIHDSDDSYFTIHFYPFYPFQTASEIFCIRNNIKTWRTIACIPLRTAVSRYFQNLIRITRNLEYMIIYSFAFPFETTSIKHLERIENLEIRQECPVDLIKCGFLDVESLCNVCNRLQITGVYLSASELHRLNATFINIWPMTIPSKEINKYLKLMYREVSGKPYASILFNWAEGHELDFDEVTRGLPIYTTADARALTFINPKMANVFIGRNMLRLEICPIRKNWRDNSTLFDIIRLH